jgi:hypothetical protein
VFWHDAVAAALAADVTQGQGAKPHKPEARRRAPTHIERISQTSKVDRRRHARPHPHHPVKLTYSQDGTSKLSFVEWNWRMCRAILLSRMVEGSSNCTSLLVLPPQILYLCIYRRNRMLICCNSLLSPRSYVYPRSHRPFIPTEYSQPL